MKEAYKMKGLSNTLKKILPLLISVTLLGFGCKTHSKFSVADIKPKIEMDTISFVIGEDNGIHIKGSINNSEPLDFIFDTGANAFAVSSTVIGSKVNIRIDGQAMNKGAGGTSTMDVSVDDKIEIGMFHWENNPIVSIPYKNPKFDAVVGLNAFPNKIIEVDYDNNNLIIHDSLEVIPKGYEKIESKRDFNLFFIKALTDVDGNQSNDWFLLDTGCNSNLVLNQDYLDTHNIIAKLKKIDTANYLGSTGTPLVVNSYILPKFKLINHSLSNVLIDVNQKSSSEPSSFNVLCNGIMKHFNIIIDLNKNLLYIKTNKSFKNPQPFQGLKN